MAASWKSPAAGNMMNCLALRRYDAGGDPGERVDVWYTNQQASAVVLELPVSVPKNEPVPFCQTQYDKLRRIPGPKKIMYITMLLESRNVHSAASKIRHYTPALISTGQMLINEDAGEAVKYSTLST